MRFHPKTRFLFQVRSHITLLFVSFVVLSSINESTGQPRTIHAMVALCDNENQGIVLVPETLGNGEDPANNLYWGAMYGLKSFLIHSSQNWELIDQLKTSDSSILERLLFKHRTNDVYLLADAYKGKEIRNAIVKFLATSNGQLPETIQLDTSVLKFGGKADLLVYLGHNGLMDFDVSVDYHSESEPGREGIILACFSKSYFSQELRQTRAIPLLWSSHLMAPEAYTLEAALEGWILNENNEEIRERAARAYHQYQKCGLNAAKRLLVTGY